MKDHKGLAEGLDAELRDRCEGKFLAADKKGILRLEDVCT